MNIQTNYRVGMNYLRVKNVDGKALKILSNIAESQLLTRGQEEDFSFPATGFVVFKNVTEEALRIEWTVLKSEAGLMCRSSRQGARTFSESNQSLRYELRAGEALTFVALNHTTPQGALSI